MSLNQKLVDLHGKLVDACLSKLTSDEPPTAAEITAALNVLKHNNITALPEAEPGLRELEKQLSEIGSAASNLPFPRRAADG